jgi:hypothetical protein
VTQKRTFAIPSVRFNYFQQHKSNKKRASSQPYKRCNKTRNGLGERIRTSGLLNPIQARYQTALHPDISFTCKIYYNISPAACQYNFPSKIRTAFNHDMQFVQCPTTLPGIERLRPADVKSKEQQSKVLPLLSLYCTAGYILRQLGIMLIVSPPGNNSCYQKQPFGLLGLHHYSA